MRAKLEIWIPLPKGLPKDPEKLKRVLRENPEARAKYLRACLSALNAEITKKETALAISLSETQRRQRAS